MKKLYITLVLIFVFIITANAQDFASVDNSYVIAEVDVLETKYTASKKH